MRGGIMLNKTDEIDKFWDLSKLVPKKAPIRPFSAEIKTALHTVGVQEQTDSRDVQSNRLTFKNLGQPTEKLPDTVYEPMSGGLIKRVTIKRTLDRFDFYGNFRKAALLYFHFKAQKCEFVPFYSYAPQYSQLTTEQKNYYFYWREELRNGNYIKSDYSYITLYVYEILNLPDLIPPSDGIKLLALVWKNYRAALPRIDTSFSVWVQDYCLVHQLECPIDIIGDFMHEIIELSGFPEFYLSATLGTSPEGMSVLISYLSDYDWRRAKHLASDADGFYKKHLMRSVGRLIYALWADGSFMSEAGEIRRISRSAFPKSLVTHSVKCTLEIEFYSALSSRALRESVTNAVRYAENKLRCAMGIKSRLAVKEMNGYHKHILDKYFEGILAAEAEKRRKEAIPEYEKLYDAPRVDMSVSGADEIEHASWQNTERLIAYSVEEYEPVEILPPKEDTIITEIEVNTELYAKNDENGSKLSESEREFLASVMNGTASQSAECDLAAERINELALDTVGDILIEILDGAYALIEDYREDAERLINNG